MKEEIKKIESQFADMDRRYFLFGMLNAFMNRLQVVGDAFFEEISWKQCFVIICVNLFPKPPAIKELAEVMGSSHQNIKQLLLKLQNMGYIELRKDELDRRKQLIYMTEQGQELCRKYDKPSEGFMTDLFEGIDEKAVEVTVRTIMAMAENLSDFQL